MYCTQPTLCARVLRPDEFAVREDEHDQPRLNVDAPPYLGSERYGHHVGSVQTDAELTDDDVFEPVVPVGPDDPDHRDAGLRTLQHRALNEVFIGETLSARCALLRRAQVL